MRDEVRSQNLELETRREAESLDCDVIMSELFALCIVLV
jgi:hypothetical protein